MKKIRFFTLIVFITLCFIAVAYAGNTVTGYVVKLEKEFVTIEDSETGEDVRVHFDKRTKVRGKLGVDVWVELQEDDGHAVSIKVIEEDIEVDEF
jgi:hypothetical protein